jgi:hypothetical protein
MQVDELPVWQNHRLTLPDFCNEVRKNADFVVLGNRESALYVTMEIGRRADKRRAFNKKHLVEALNALDSAVKARRKRKDD